MFHASTASAAPGGLRRPTDQQTRSNRPPEQIENGDNMTMLNRPATSEISLPAQHAAAATTGLDAFATGGAGDVVWLLARCLIGGIFVYSGFGKLTGLEGFAASLAKNG